MIPLLFALGLAATRLGRVDLDKAWDGRHWDGPCFHSPNCSCISSFFSKIESGQQWLRLGNSARCLGCWLFMLRMRSNPGDQEHQVVVTNTALACSSGSEATVSATTIPRLGRNGQEAQASQTNSVHRAGFQLVGLDLTLGSE